MNEIEVTRHPDSAFRLHRGNVVPAYAVKVRGRYLTNAVGIIRNFVHEARAREAGIKELARLDSQRMR